MTRALEKVAKTFARIERQKSETLASIERWPQSRLVFRPDVGAWSAIEVIDHLVKVESGVVSATKQGLENPHRLRVRDRLGFIFLDRVFRSPMKVKVPGNVAQILPELSITLESLRDRWAGTRNDLTRLLTPLEPSQLRLGVFRHPVSGWMSVPQVLCFFSAHIRHHGFQLARILAASQRQSEVGA